MRIQFSVLEGFFFLGYYIYICIELNVILFKRFLIFIVTGFIEVVVV